MNNDSETLKANEDFRREFTATVAHELKTPLTAILGAIEMIDDESSLSAGERKELLGIVKEQSKRLSSLVRDILALTRLERDQNEERLDFISFPLETVVETVVELESPRAKEADVELSVVNNDPVIIYGDAHRLEQALENLIENALRYSGSKRIEVSVEVDENDAVLSVTDFGVGVPRESLPHLFERFYRVDKARSRSLGGTGLGLAIVKHIAILHGGEVSVVSEQGIRTTFSLRIPVERK